jgi:RNA polymerase sigma-70 factor (ECF subfamily)
MTNGNPVHGTVCPTMCPNVKELPTDALPHLLQPRIKKVWALSTKHLPHLQKMPLVVGIFLPVKISFEPPPALPRKSKQKGRTTLVTLLEERASTREKTTLGDPLEIQWLKEAQQGDPDAFEQLQYRLEPQIKHFIRRLTNVDDDMVEDLAQDVFISLYLHLREIDPPEKLRPYVFRIARNRCWDELRRRGRRQTLSLDDEPVEMWVSFTDTTNKPDDLTHWMLLYMEVQEAMEELPELQRQALILYSEENLSYAEIAEVMETNVGTIKSRLYHAKQTLRRLLRPETLQAIEMS